MTNEQYSEELNKILSEKDSTFIHGTCKAGMSILAMQTKSTEENKEMLDNIKEM